MRCTHCQREIAEYSNFCYFCGKRQGAAAATAQPGASKRLMRSATDVKIAGVCAGFAEHFGWDPTVVRLIWAILTIFPVPVMGVVGYIVAWVVMPVAPLPVAAPVQAAQPSAAQPAQPA